MTEEEHPKIIHLHKPTQCVLWEQPNRIAGKFVELLEEVESYEDGSHLTRSLYKCRECGQLYFHEWYEWVDWKEGKDKIYTTLIPVHGDGQSEFIQVADTALYQAKHAGRNRVETLTSLAALQATQAPTDGSTSSRNRLLRILGRNDR